MDDTMHKFTFDLRWFDNYSSKALHHVSHVQTPSYANISLLVTSPGQYWCRVLDYTDGPEVLLGSSNVAEVLSWEQYSSLPMCNGVQSVMESKCADTITTTTINNRPFTTEIQTHTVTGKPLYMYSNHNC